MMHYKLKEPTEHKVIVNGHEITAMVQYLYDHDEEPIDVNFGSDEEDEAYRERFASGQLSSLNILIKATWRDVVGTDSLCACHVLSRDAEKELLDMIGPHDMVSNALAELKQHIEQNVAVYAVFTKKGNK